MEENLECRAERCKWLPFAKFTLSKAGEPNREFCYCGLHEIQAYKRLSAAAFKEGYKLIVERVKGIEGK